LSGPGVSSTVSGAAVARRPVREAVAQRGEELREVLHPEVAEELREGARDDDAVLQRVARAGRRLRAVVDHPPAAVGRTREVGGVEVQQHVAGGRAPRQGRRKPAWP
jgi:hypothetical protein